MRTFLNFLRNEDGAVTVDWVAMTAAVVLLGFGIIFMLTQAATDEASGLGAWLGTVEVE